MHAAADTLPRSYNQLKDVFSNNTFVGSSLLDDRAMVFTDSRIHSDGFGRMLLLSKPYDADVQNLTYDAAKPHSLYSKDRTPRYNEGEINAGDLGLSPGQVSLRGNWFSAVSWTWLVGRASARFIWLPEFGL